MQLIGISADVFAEPTGWHYFQPLVHALDLFGGDYDIWHINHQTTASMRRAYFGRAKNDRIDARAIAFAGLQHLTVQAISGIKLYDPITHQAAHSLRLLVNEYRRLTKQSTRRLNQLDQMGHSIFPQLAISKTTWLKCISYGAITPAQIHQLVTERPAHINGRQMRHIRELSEKLPVLDANPMIVQNVQRMYQSYNHLQGEVRAIADEIYPSHR